MLLWQCTIGCVIENALVMLGICTGVPWQQPIPFSWWWLQWTFWASWPLAKDTLQPQPLSNGTPAWLHLTKKKCPGLWSSPGELRDSIWAVWGWGVEEPATTSEPNISAQGGFNLSPDLHPNSRALRSNLFHFVLSEWFVFASCWSSCCVLQNHLRLGCCFYIELLFKTWIWQRT